jgi:anti-sigma B factor antagonist
LPAVPDVRVLSDGATVTIALAGEIDVNVADELSEAVSEALAAEPEVVVVDLSAATFLDSAGVGALVTLNNAAVAAGVPTVQLKNGPSNVMRVLELVGLDDLFQSLS